MKRLLVALLTASLVTLLAPELGQAGDALITGERFNFSTLPRWTHSGVWAPDGKRLLLVDAISSRVRLYDPEGQYQENLKDESTGQDYSNIVKVHRADINSFWAEDEDGRFILLDQQYKVLQTRDIQPLAKGGDGDLRGIYQWVPSGSDFLLFGDIRKGDSATSAFLTVPLDNPQKFKTLGTLGIDDPSRRFYLLGSPYLASVKGRPYVIVMSESPYILTPDGDKIYFVQTGPDGKSHPIHRPDLPTQKGLNASRLVFQSIQESTLPVGIYGWHDFLYVLMRMPLSQGRTQWSLLKVDPSAKRAVQTRPIDSTADHMTVVPGEKYWAFIEKGLVEAPGQQTIRSFLRVPSANVEH